MQRLLKKYTFPVARSAQMYWKSKSGFFQSLEKKKGDFPVIGNLPHAVMNNLVLRPYLMGV